MYRGEVEKLTGLDTSSAMLHRPSSYQGKVQPVCLGAGLKLPNQDADPSPGFGVIKHWFRLRTQQDLGKFPNAFCF